MSRALQRWVLAFILSAAALYYVIHLKQQDTSGESHLGSAPPAPTHVNWASVKQRYPVTDYAKLPPGPPKQLPRVQASFPPETAADKTTRLARQRAVKEVFLRSWGAYRDHAWGHDEFSPLTKAFKDHWGGWGATMVDSLDTLLIMGLQTEFAEAVKHIDSVDFTVTHMKTINVFETTIRYLGGMLGAIDLANGKDNGVLLKKAIELSEMLYHAFDTVNRIPLTRWTWQNNLNGLAEGPHTYIIAAELGSMSMEFTRMTQLTGDARFYDAVKRITDILEREQSHTKIPGLWPTVFDGQKVSFQKDFLFTMGGRADSLYEYVPKEHILLGGSSGQYQKMYDAFMDKAKQHLFFRPMNPNNLDILLAGSAEAQVDQIKLKPEGQHLSCFIGGMVALASKVFQNEADLQIAKKLVDGCSWAYSTTESGIMPEVFIAIPPEGDPENKWDKKRWHAAINAMVPPGSPDEVKDADARAEKIASSLRIPEGMASVIDRRYMLRPEAIESLFVLYRITADKKYQEVAWKMFTSIVGATQTDLSYATVLDTTAHRSTQLDASESFWTAETLKYFYLIFSEPELVSLDDYVFNTEAHPFKIPKPS